MNRMGLLIGALVAVLLTAGWWFLLVSPQNERVADAEDELANLENQEIQLRAERNSLQVVEDNMLEYLAALGELETSIPPDPQTAALIDDLAVLADETGVAWRAGTYGQPAELDGGVFEIPLAITLEGQFFEVLGYLYGIAEMDRLVRVDSITISPTQDEQGFTILNVAIGARAFTTSDLAIPIPEDGEAAPADETTEPPEPEDGEGGEDAEGGDAAIPAGARF